MAMYCAVRGVAYPGDMEALKRIYDDLCLERGFFDGSQAAEDLARAMMSLFSQGVKDEGEIRESIELYLGRKSGAAQLLRGAAGQPQSSVPGGVGEAAKTSP